MYLMLNILFLLMLISFISMLLMIINFLLSMMNKLNREKNTPFECGFNPNSKIRLPFTTQYFLITLLFLIFDIEIMLIIPSIFFIKMFNSFMLSIIILMFLLLLILSLIYEWMFSMLNWII